MKKVVMKFRFSVVISGLAALVLTSACEQKSKDGVLSGMAPTMSIYSEACYGQINPSSGLFSNYMAPMYQVSGRNNAVPNLTSGVYSEAKITCKDDRELQKSASSIVAVNSAYGFTQLQGLSCDTSVAQGVYVGMSVKLNADNTVNSSASYLRIRAVDSYNQSVDLISGVLSGKIVGDQAQLSLTDSMGVLSLLGTVTTTSFKGTMSFRNSTSSPYVLGKGVLGSFEIPFCGTFSY